MSLRNFNDKLGILSNLPESAPKGACLAALGVLAGDLLPKPRSATTYFDAGWRRTGSTIEGGVWDDQNRGYFVMYPKRRLIYDAQKWKGSEYTINGYSGPAETDLAPLASSEFVGDYFKLPSAPPPPH